LNFKQTHQEYNQVEEIYQTEETAPSSRCYKRLHVERQELTAMGFLRCSVMLLLGNVIELLIMSLSFF